jgi:hypothetical protein
MILETILVLAGAAAKPTYEKWVEPLIDAELAAIRSECRTLFLKRKAALKKERQEEREAAKAKAAKVAAH